MRWSLWRKPPRGDLLDRVATEWRETVDAIEWPILALRVDGRIARLNRAAQKLAGREFDHLVDRPVGSVGSWQPWPEISEMTRAVAETRTGTSRRIVGERGRAWQVSASFSPSPSPDGNRVIIVARDLTAVARLEAQLQRSETMATMGTIVSGVAHEVRNPLFAISATIDAVEACFGSRKELGPFVATLRGEVERLGRLMRDLLEYGRPPELELHEVDVRAVVAGAVGSCESLAKQRQVSVRNGVGQGLPRLRLDPGRAAQAVRNLVENALYHSSTGTEVDIGAAVFSAEERTWVEVSVADRGPGFRSEDLSRVFDPFYTRRRGGTGLGLSIVKRIAEAHGGTVDAGNRPDGGAVMRLILPLAVRARERGRPPAACAEDSAPDSRI